LYNFPLFVPLRAALTIHKACRSSRRVFLAIIHAAGILIDIVLVASYLLSSTPPASSPPSSLTSYSSRHIVQLPTVCHSESCANNSQSSIRKKNVRPDAPGARDTLDAPWQRTYRSQRKTHRQCEFGCSTPRHHSPGRSSPRHLLTGRSVAGHFRSRRTVSGYFPSGRTVSGHFPSRRSRVRVFSFWMQPCQGIFLLDAAVSGYFPSGRSRVRANGIRTTRVMAPWLRWLLRHATSQQILASHSQTLSGLQA